MTFLARVSREAMTEAADQITGLLRDRHHLTSAKDDDFNVRRPEDLIQTQIATSQIMTILLASVASLSLLIGGIGIMNIMLVSVTQRTREIAVRLAVGATEWAVQLQFLSEAVALSMLGGATGNAGRSFFHRPSSSVYVWAPIERPQISLTVYSFC
jgi:putative ABC transport system permease protein